MMAIQELAKNIEREWKWTMRYIIDWTGYRQRLANSNWVQLNRRAN